MLATLKHLLTFQALLFIGLLAGQEISFALSSDGTTRAIMLGTIAISTVFFLSWPTFRLIGLRPLGLPRCPHCGNQHANYYVPAEAWPVAIIVCVHCSKPLRLRMGGKSASPPPAGHVPTIPTAVLRWPKFIGLWDYEP